MSQEWQGPLRPGEKPNTPYIPPVENPANIQEPEKPEEKRENVENVEQELSPEQIEKVMEKVWDINEIGTAHTTIWKKDFDKIMHQGLLGCGPHQRMKHADDYTQRWVNNVRKKRMGQVFFNIVGISGNPFEHYSPDKSYASMKESSFEPEITIIFDLSKYEANPSYSENFVDGGQYDGKQKPNTYRYSEDRYEESTKEMAKKYYDERQLELKSNPGRHRRFPKDDLEFNDDNWQLFLPKAHPKFGFNLSFRVAPRLFRGIVVKPLRKLNDSEIQAELEKNEIWYKEELTKRESDALYRERVILDLDMVKNFYEGKKETVVNEETEELDPEKKLKFAENIASKMIGINKQKTKNLLPIYDYDGNLLWPKQMSYEEVKKFVAEREAKKQEKL